MKAQGSELQVLAESMCNKWQRWTVLGQAAIAAPAGHKAQGLCAERLVHFGARGGT